MCKPVTLLYWKEEGMTISLEILLNEERVNLHLHSKLTLVSCVFPGNIPLTGLHYSYLHLLLFLAGHDI